MKSLFRSKPVTILLGFLIWSWMAMIGRTVRWTVEGATEARASWVSSPGIIIAIWHSRIMLIPSGWTRLIRFWPGRTADVSMLISMSGDGEPVARAMRHFGVGTIRGSAGNKKKVRKDKGGARAIIDAVKLLKSGGALCITPDGPRGPREQAGLGAILIAQRAGAPILPYAVTTRPAKRLNSWDGFFIPFPFTKGAIVFGELLQAPRDADPEMLRAELQRRLDTATRRSESLAGYETSHTEVEPTRE
ncbi:lysophospholipid acyltransferase family protein [Hyphomonas sp.]